MTPNVSYATKISTACSYIEDLTIIHGSVQKNKFQNTILYFFFKVLSDKDAYKVDNNSSISKMGMCKEECDFFSNMGL